MISHEYQCIFIHIPKCAGTSIENAFGHFKNHVGPGGQDHRTIRYLESLSKNILYLTREKDNFLTLLRRARYFFLKT